MERGNSSSAATTTFCRRYTSDPIGYMCRGASSVFLDFETGRFIDKIKCVCGVISARLNWLNGARSTGSLMSRAAACHHAITPSATTQLRSYLSRSHLIQFAISKLSYQVSKKLHTTNK